MESKKILKTFRTCAAIPGGRRLFNRLLGIAVPYTGRLGAEVEDLQPGYARITLKERRGVKNHLNCVHAMALANLGEMATGLAVVTALPPDSRGIVTDFRIEYLKKARGVLTCEAHHELMGPVTESSEFEIGADIVDAAKVCVARVKVQWRIGPATKGKK